MSELREKIEGKIRISLLSANIAGGRYEPRINNHRRWHHRERGKNTHERQGQCTADITQTSVWKKTTGYGGANP